MKGLGISKILGSVALIAFTGAVAVSATGAFFSDTETSTGNTFTAGDIDLQIDNESYVTSTTTGALIASPWTSWAMTDLVAGTHRFFDFIDVKPGDVGEDTISIHVGSNAAWMCAAARITDDSDQTLTEPEMSDDLATSTFPGTNLGELDSSLQFAFWTDDGDNVLETDEVANIFLQGTLASMGAQGKIRLADSSGSILGGTSPIPGETTFYIAKAWCMGTLASNAVLQDGLGKAGTPSNPSTPNGPLIRGTGVSCDGAPVNNAAQTDRVVGDMQFYAVQSRNNATFTCASNYNGFNIQ